MTSSESEGRWVRLAPLRIVNFRRLFLSQTISAFGDSFATIGLAFSVLAITGSPIVLGVVLAVRSVAVAGAVLMGGVLGDHFSRRTILAICDFVRFGTQGVMAFLVWQEAIGAWGFAALQLVYGIATAFYEPASTGLVANTAGLQHVQPANALLRISTSAAEVIGPMAAGLLVAITSPALALGVDAATYLVAGLLVLAVRGLGRVAPPEQSTLDIRRSIREGWQEVRRHRWLGPSLLGFAIFQAVGFPALYVLGPTMAEESLGGAGVWGTTMGLLSVGVLLGGVASLWYRPARPVAFVFGCLAGYAVVLAALALEAPLWLILATALVSGAGITAGDIRWESYLQEQIPDAALSRVAAVDRMASTALRPVGFAVIGPIAAGAGLATTLLVASIVLAASMLATALWPSVYAQRERPTLAVDPA
jgi:MFS family permease